jgi:LmbE family N-acetylglucosaminyl deacetylase
MPLEPLPEDFDRVLAVVAHPDDLEYGAASAVARWTDAGKDVRYLLVSRGEAGIEGMPPWEAGPRREAEQRASAAVVGVSAVEFLDHADGMIEAGIPLRRDLARAIRRHRPDAIVSINHRESWGPGSWNHVDHRAVGVALLDAVRDAANSWTFTELRAEGLDAWSATKFVAFGASTQSTHYVDVSATIDKGVASLREHRAYLEGLGDGGTDPDAMLRGWSAGVGAEVGVAHAVAFEVIWS